MSRTVFDCVVYNGESHLLQMRINELAAVVDTFVVVEADQTHSGAPRFQSFHINDARFSPYADRIRHVMVEDFPETDDPWVREAWQRDALVRALGDARPEDLVVISDVDEIPRASVVRALADGDVTTSYALTLRFYYFYLNYRNVSGPESDTTWNIAVPRFVLEEWTPTQIRLGVRRGTVAASIVRDAGWHFSYLGDRPGVTRKIRSFAHQEWNTESFLSQIDISEIVRDGRDLFGREGFEWSIVHDEELPKYVQDNMQKFDRYFAR